MRRLIGLLVFTCIVTGCKSREEKLQAAEEQGNLLVSAKARVVKGVGEALKTEGSGEVVKAVGAGFDKSMSQVKLAVHQELPAKGVGATRAARQDVHAARHSVTVYVTVDKPYAGPLELRAYDAANMEIGRAKVALDEKESTAKYVDFEFDPRTPLLTADHFELR